MTRLLSLLSLVAALLRLVVYLTVTALQILLAAVRWRIEDWREGRRQRRAA